jgi:hypothetical protein
MFQSPLLTHGFMNNFMAELKALAEPPSTAERVPWPGPRAQPRWIRPSTPIPKINFDASVSKTKDKGVSTTQVCWTQAFVWPL